MSAHPWLGYDDTALRCANERLHNVLARDRANRRERKAHIKITARSEHHPNQNAIDKIARRLDTE